jgi:hypothetical protein
MQYPSPPHPPDASSTVSLNLTNDAGSWYVRVWYSDAYVAASTTPVASGVGMW